LQALFRGRYPEDRSRFRCICLNDLSAAVAIVSSQLTALATPFVGVARQFQEATNLDERYAWFLACLEDCYCDSGVKGGLTSLGGGIEFVNDLNGRPAAMIDSVVPSAWVAFNKLVKNI
jgi:hypothetical protein